MPPLVESRLKMPHSSRSESGRLGSRQVARVAQPPEVLLDLHESGVLRSAQLATDDVQRQAHGVGGRHAFLASNGHPRLAGASRGVGARSHGPSSRGQTAGR